MLVGRSTTTDYAFEKDSKMSSVHFRLSCSEDACTIEDMGSTNGTKLNDETITKEQVHSGDKIVAGATQFTVKIEQTLTESATQTPPDHASSGTILSPVPSPPEPDQAAMNPEPTATDSKIEPDIEAGTELDSGDSGSHTNQRTDVGAIPAKPCPPDEAVENAKQMPPSPTAVKLASLGVSPKVAALVSTVESHPNGLPLGQLMEMLNKPDDEFAPPPPVDDNEHVSTNTTSEFEWGPGVKLVTTIKTSNGDERVVPQRVGQVITFGRSSDCDCAIENDDAMAARQFLISCNNSQSTLFHFDADIPTLVNGTAVKQHVLQHGTIIDAGNSQFRVHIKQ